MRSPLALLVLAVLPSACIINNRYEPPPDPFGDLAFDWSFDGVTSCDAAGVDEVDVAIFADGQLFLDLQSEPCEGGGLLFPDMPVGLYEVFLDAYDRESRLLYAGSFDVLVEGGITNDAGLVVFDRIGDAPPETGELALFWVFPYPTNEIFDCALAGVEEVDVHLEPLGVSGAPYDDTFACDEEGLSVSNLPEGRYHLRLQGFGSYHGDDLLLYDTGNLVVEVFAGDLTDLGDVAVDRIDESFADFDVTWAFLDETCASVGVEDVTLAFQRIGFVEPEDSFAIDCVAPGVLRRTFVPGSYTVTAFGVGAEDDYLATTSVDLPPNSVAEIDLTLAPIP